MKPFLAMIFWYVELKMEYMYSFMVITIWFDFHARDAFSVFPVEFFNT